MLLRNSISSTKKFIQKTFNNFKSFLSIGNTYHKLPNTPSFHLFSCGCNTKDQVQNHTIYTHDLDHFYNEFTNQWDSFKKKNNQNGKWDYSAKIEENEINPEKNYDLESKGSNSCKNSAENGDILKNKRFKISPRIVRKPELCSRSVREERFCYVVEKLKKLKEIDKGNKVDYQEFMHFYSRLTCPAYLDLVDKFLLEMCNEFFDSQHCAKIRFRSPSQNKFHVETTLGMGKRGRHPGSQQK